MSEPFATGKDDYQK